METLILETINVPILAMYIYGFTSISLIITMIAIKKLLSKISLQNTSIKILEDEIKKLKKPMHIDDANKYLNLLDKLLITKFNYYIFSNFLANLEKRKEISKENIKSIKNEFYIDVSSTLQTEQKYKLLEVFSEKGIEMYIHQFFLQKLNELDVKYKKQEASLTETSPAESLLKEIYKG